MILVQALNNGTISIRAGTSVFKAAQDGAYAEVALTMKTITKKIDGSSMTFSGIADRVLRYDQLVGPSFLANTDDVVSIQVQTTAVQQFMNAFGYLLTPMKLNDVAGLTLTLTDFVPDIQLITNGFNGTVFAALELYSSALKLVIGESNAALHFRIPPPTYNAAMKTVGLKIVDLKLVSLTLDNPTARFSDAISNIINWFLIPNVEDTLNDEICKFLDANPLALEPITNFPLDGMTTSINIVDVAIKARTFPVVSDDAGILQAVGQVQITAKKDS